MLLAPNLVEKSSKCAHRLVKRLNSRTRRSVRAQNPFLVLNRPLQVKQEKYIRDSPFSFLHGLSPLARIAPSHPPRQDIPIGFSRLFSRFYLSFTVLSKDLALEVHKVEECSLLCSASSSLYYFPHGALVSAFLRLQVCISQSEGEAVPSLCPSHLVRWQT